MSQNECLSHVSQRTRSKVENLRTDCAVLAEAGVSDDTGDRSHDLGTGEVSAVDSDGHRCGRRSNGVAGDVLDVDLWLGGEVCAVNETGGLSLEAQLGSGTRGQSHGRISGEVRAGDSRG